MLAIRYELGWRFTTEEPGREYGIDAFAAVDGEGVDELLTGRMLALQIKGGSSFFRRRVRGGGGGWVFRECVNHLAYWYSFSLPVLIVLVRPSDNAVFWQHLTPENVDERRDGFTLLVPESQQLGTAARDQLIRIAYRPDGIIDSFDRNCATLPPGRGRQAPGRCGGRSLGSIPAR